MSNKDVLDEILSKAKQFKELDEICEFLADNKVCDGCDDCDCCPIGKRISQIEADLRMLLKGEAEKHE